MRLLDGGGERTDLRAPHRGREARGATRPGTQAGGRRPAFAIRTARLVALAGLLAILGAPAADATGGRWSRRFVAGLPDEAFAVVHVRPDGTRWRRLPHHRADGELDRAHLRSALGRLPQVRWPDPADADVARRHLLGHAAALGWRAAEDPEGAATATVRRSGAGGRRVERDEARARVGGEVVRRSGAGARRVDPSGSAP
jgi:hypothetical protein